MRGGDHLLKAVAMMSLATLGFLFALFTTTSFPHLLTHGLPALLLVLGASSLPTSNTRCLAVPIQLGDASLFDLPDSQFPYGRVGQSPKKRDRHTDPAGPTHRYPDNFLRCYLCASLSVRRSSTNCVYLREMEAKNRSFDRARQLTLSNWSYTSHTPRRLISRQTTAPNS